MIVHGSLRESGDAGEDLIGALGPGKRFRIGVMGVDEGADGGFEFGDAAMNASPDLLVRQFGEPPLNEVEPRSIRRGEVHMWS